MSRLDYSNEIREASAGASASGPYQPVTLWEVGIPVDSLKQIDRSHFSQVGVGAGAVITVWGSMITKFDNPTPLFDVTVPVTNGNPFTAISGTLKRQRDTQQLSFGPSIFGNPNTQVGISGSVTNGSPNEVWDFKFTYTLT